MIQLIIPDLFVYNCHRKHRLYKKYILFYPNNFTCFIFIIQTTGIHIGTFLEAFGNLGIGTIISLIYGWELTLVMIGFLPFIIIIGVLNTKLTSKFSKKDSQAFKEASNVYHLNYIVYSLIFLSIFVAIIGSS